MSMVVSVGLAAKAQNTGVTYAFQASNAFFFTSTTKNDTVSKPSKGMKHGWSNAKAWPQCFGYFMSRNMLKIFPIPNESIIQGSSDAEQLLWLELQYLCQLFLSILYSVHAEQRHPDVKHAGVSLFMGAGSQALVVMSM